MLINDSKQIFCMDGTTAIKDTVHDLAATVEGDPGFATLMGVQAPIVAASTVNLLSDVNSEFETGVGGWVGGYGSPSTLSSSTDWAHTGTHSLKITPVTALTAGVSVADVTTAGWGYEATCHFKGVAGKSYWLMAWDDVGGGQSGAVVTGTGADQTVSFEWVFGAGTQRQLLFIGDSTASAEITYIDTVTLVVLPCISFPTDSLGITPGMPVSIVCVVNTPAAWDETRVMYINLQDDPGVDLEGFEVVLAYGSVFIGCWHQLEWKWMGISTNVSNWAPNVDHVIVGTIDEENNQRIFLDGVEGFYGGSTPGACTRETSVGANSYVGSHPDGKFPIDGPILVAAYGRVLDDAEIALVNSTPLWTDIIDSPSPPALGAERDGLGYGVEVWDKADTERLSILSPDNEDPDLVYQDLEFSNNHWGYLSCTFMLKRDSDLYYEDLEDSNIVRVLSGGVVWEGDIESVSRDKDTETTLKVECLGPQAKLKNMGTNADYDRDLEPGEKASTYIVDHILSDPDLLLFAGDIGTNDFEIVTGCSFFPGKAFDQIFSQLMEYNQYRPSIWLDNKLDWKPRETTPTYYVNISDCEQSSLNRKRASIKNWIQVAFSPDNSVYGYIVAFDQTSIDRHGKRSEYLSIRGDETDANQVAATALAQLKDLKPASALTTDIIHDVYGALVPPEEVESNHVLHIERLLSTEETIESVQSINESNTWEIAEVKYKDGKVTLSPGEEDDTLDVLLKQLDSRFL